MGMRALNNTALHMLTVALLAQDKAADASELVKKHYQNARNMTDGLAALTEAVHQKLNCAQELLADFDSKNLLTIH